MSKDFRERFDVELGKLHRSDGKGVSHFMEAHFREAMLLQEPRKELTIGARLGRLALAGKEVVVGIVRDELAQRDEQHRRQRNCPF